MRKTYEAMRGIALKNIDDHIDANFERIGLVWKHLDIYLDDEYKKFTSGCKRILIEEHIQNKKAGYEDCQMWLTELHQLGIINYELLQLRKDISKA